MNVINPLMDKRRNQIIAVLLFSIIPFLGWFANVLVSLVTLRKGPREGAILMAFATLPALAHSLASYGIIPLISEIVLALLPIYALSFLLRQTQSWTLVIHIASAFTLLLLLGFYFYIGDPNTFWNDFYTELASVADIETIIQESLKNLPLEQMSPLAFKGFFIEFAIKITPILTFALYLNTLGCILVARWLQARNYNPGGLKKELETLHIFWTTIALFAFVSLAYGFSLTPMLSLAAVLLIGFPICCAGLSVIHVFHDRGQYHKAWLFLLYLSLLLLIPVVSAVLIIIACADKYYNFRPIKPIYQL